MMTLILLLVHLLVLTMVLFLSALTTAALSCPPEAHLRTLWRTLPLKQDLCHKLVVFLLLLLHRMR